MQHPACPYAVAKVASEKYLQYLNYAHKFPAVCLRQTNCYGRKENDYFIVEAAITQMLKNPNEINLGAAEPVRNFLFIDDLVALYKTLLTAEKHVDGESFNTGPDNGLRIDDLVLKIARILDWRGHVNWNTRPRRPGEIFYLNSSNRLVTAKTGWEPKVSLDEGLKRTIKLWT